MNDDDLKKLQNRPVPPPSEKAKLAAVDAAMAAFDAAGEDIVEEKATSTQGSAADPRPRTSFIANAWSWFMKKRFASPAAASLLILPVAGYVVYQFVQDYPAPPQVIAGEPQALKAAPEKPAGEKDELVENMVNNATKADDKSVVAGQRKNSEGFSDAGRVINEEVLADAETRLDNLQRSSDEQFAAAPGPSDRQGSEQRIIGPSLGIDSDGAASAGADGVDTAVTGQASNTVSGAYRTEPNAVSSAENKNGVGKLKLPRAEIERQVDMAARSEKPRAKIQELQKARPERHLKSDGGGGTITSMGGSAGGGRVQALVAPRPQPEPQRLRERDVIAPEQTENRDQFAAFKDNDAKIVKDDPVTTFSVNVDTASYAFVRRSLEEGRLPPRDSVRVEEMINYFSYDYPAPDNAEEPFRASVALYPTPWNPQTKLMHIGIKGFAVMPDVRPASNLVFLIDVSGSMNQPDKLPLLKNAFRMLVGQLDENDTVSIVTYAGRAGTVLEPTSAKEKRRILAAIDNLRPGGSTAGAAGIEEAYRLAGEAFKEDGVNRVILATDGDFNVGISDPDRLKRFIEKKRRSGTFLSVLGFGQGNYNDTLMQSLAQNGNGIAAYIDSLNEAQKVLVEEASANLFPIAKDVKIQIEFNPARVSEYRLIGYETRALRNQDFSNDKVDAGDIGSGHTVTAIYELTLAGSAISQLDNRRYAQPADEVRPEPANSGEFAFLKLRYKLPDEDRSKLVTLPVTDALTADRADQLSDDMRFAAAVAAFGQKLRDNRALDDFSYDEIAKLASSARGTDPFGYRGAFLSLVRLAGSLDQ